MLHRFTTLLLPPSGASVLCFLDMLRNSVHQRMEARITRHVFRITGPQCRDQLSDALVLLTGFPDEGFFLVVGLVDTGGVKHGLFYERIEFQGDQHVGSHLLSQVWITDVLIVLEQVSAPSGDQL